MRNISPTFLDALMRSQETGIAPRQFLFIQAKEFVTNFPMNIGFWTGDEDITITVVNPVTGLPEARDYFGSQNLHLSPIARNSRMEIEEVVATLSQITMEAQLAVRGYDLRLAKAEIHECVMDGRAPIAPPECVFLGEIDAAPMNTPEVGQTGEFSITLVSDAISMLNKTNPLMSSFEGQKQRNPNDYFGMFASTVSKVDIPWGRKKK